MSAVVSLKGVARRRDWTPWIGRAVGVVPALALGLSAAMKLAHPAKVVEMFVQKFGFQESALLPLGLLELTCMLLYVIPRTRMLGALLVTAYLGGAVATHVRVNDPFFVPVALGVLVWAGLYLRDPRVVALVTLHASETK